MSSKKRSEPNSSQISRRDLLKTVAGAAAVGAAALTLRPLNAQESAGKNPIDVIYMKTRSVDDPACHYPGFAPSVRVENEMRIERDVAVKMRDGVTIYTDIYRPDGATNVPAIVAWSPYGKQPGDGPRQPRGVGLAPPEGSSFGVLEISKYTKSEGPDPVWWCKHGYAIINPDARGAFKSEGNVRMASSGEGQDYHDLIEWVGTRDWSSGKVGTSGNSWLALSQWFAAAERPPHLAAIAPWEGWTDFYRHMARPGGIPEVGFAGRLASGRCGTGNVEDLVAMAHKYPLMNEYWEEKIARLDRINVPASITANFQHFHAMGSLAGFRQIASRDKWLRVLNVFEWPDYSALAQMEDLRRFFDRYLKGVQNDWESTPRVRLSVIDPGGLDQVNRPEKEWPLARTQYEKLYLDASGGTLTPQPVKSESQTRYASKTGQANFVIKFDRDTELTGYMKLRLWVEAEEADDLDLFVYVKKLDHKGEFLPSMVMGHPHPGAQGWLRVSHRELEAARSTPSEPFLTHRREQLLRPKEIVPVEIGIWPINFLWHAGQQLRVVVAGHYMETRGPDWWEGFQYQELGKGSTVIHTGGKYDSHLLVPSIPTA
jgi:predicted acyl esterase